jgi:hypothetical protein
MEPTSTHQFLKPWKHNDFILKLIMSYVNLFVLVQLFNYILINNCLGIN